MKKWGNKEKNKIMQNSRWCRMNKLLKWTLPGRQTQVIPWPYGRNSLDCEYLNNPPSLSPPPSPSCKVASLRCRTDLTRENFFANHHNIYIYIYIVPFLSPIAPLLKAAKTRKVISNANWTEWKAIWFEIRHTREFKIERERSTSSLWNHKFCSWDNAIIFPSLATHVLTVI